MITETDLKHLSRCVELARKAVDEGNAPFGSVLVSAEGAVLAEEHNEIGGGDATRHPEFALARWSAANMTPEARAKATVYTSGEHCPMCAAAHGWVGLGRIVYATSSEQLGEWLEEFGATPARVRRIAIEEIITDTPIEGPAPQFAETVRALHARCHGASA